MGGVFRVAAPASFPAIRSRVERSAAVARDLDTHPELDGRALASLWLATTPVTIRE